MSSIRMSLAALALGCSAAVPSHAASIYLTPANQDVSTSATTATMQLMMDFAASEPTIGGGIDIDVAGVATFGGFMPSSYFTSAADPAFTGFGTAHADADYEIHFGNFNGLSGKNVLGTLTLNMTQPGVAGTFTTVGLATNSFWGGFFSSTSAAPIDVAFTGASVAVVPEPQAAALFLVGLGVVSIAVRRLSVLAFEKRRPRG